MAKMAHVFITGSNRGIGLALAQEAKARGHQVTGTTRDGRNGTVALCLDDPSTIAEQLKGVGPVDLLINNAGIIGPDRQSPLDMDFAGFRKTFEVNTIAPLAVAQALLPQLRESDCAKIITVSSQMSRMSHRDPDRIAYRASKSAVNKVMQGLATALEPEGIPVAVINPGWVRTDMGGAAADEDPNVVARGILNVADMLTIENTGRFYRFTGEAIDY